MKQFDFDVAIIGGGSGGYAAARTATNAGLQTAVIDSGKVMIEAGDGVEIQTLTAGEALGWSWMFPPFCWHFTARAVERTRCTVLNGGHLLVTAEENCEFGYNLMRRVSQVAIERLQATREKMLDHSAANRPDNAREPE